MRRYAQKKRFDADMKAEGDERDDTEAQKENRCRTMCRQMPD